MFVIFAVIAVGAFAAAIIIYHKDEWSNAALILVIVGVVMFLVAVIGIIVCGCALAEGRHIDEKIEMYQTENAEIEERVAACVEEYLGHESKIIEDAAGKIEPGSTLTMIAAYPELNSAELIAKQIEVYNDNKAQIKSLMEAKIDLHVYRWVLYFG